MTSTQSTTTLRVLRAVLTGTLLWATTSAALMATERQTPPGGAWYEPVGKGFYRVLSPGDGIAWLLPPSGTQDACQAGDARDVRWSADGQRLAVTVDDGRSLTLCLYQLKSTWATRNPRRIRVERPSAMTFGKHASGALQAFDRAMGGRQRRAYTEHEVAWIPEPPEPGRISNYPAPIAFTNGREGHPTRVYGLKGIDFGPRCTSVPLDGQSRFETDETASFYQPAWIPDVPGGPHRSLGLAEVTQQAVPCGTERIVYLPDPVCDAADDCHPPTIELANACGVEAPRAAVRFPAWAPATEDENAYRLAFVKVAPGAGQAVCIRTGPLAGDKGSVVCFDDMNPNRATSRLYPTWSEDGRYLAYFEVTPPEDAAGRGPAGKPLVRIKVVDTQAVGRTAQIMTLITDVRPNPEHGPSLLTVNGTTWVFAITAKANARYDQITAVTVDPASRRTIDVDPGVQNLKAVDAVRFRGDGTTPEIRLAVVAQGFRDMVKADQSVDKVFVHVLPVERLTR